jgi:diguanylate cyclase (GGDEF)-like protein
LTALNFCAETPIRRAVEANDPLPLRIQRVSTMRRPTQRHALFGFVVLLFVALVVQLETGWGGVGSDAFFERVVYNAIPILAGLCCAMHRSPSRVERRAWLLLGSGFAAWGLGNVYYTEAFWETPAAEIPFPSLADAGYLALYLPVFVGLALLARSQLVRFSRASWLDGLIAGLTVGALGAALVFHPVLESTGGNTAAVATNLAYPLGDVILLALIVGALGLSGWRASRAWLLISVGLGCFALSDSLYLVRIANGTYEYGSFVDLGWVAASVLVAWASVIRPGAPVSSSYIRVLPLAPASFALMNVAILTYDHFARVDLLAVVLAAAGLLAVVARMTLSLLENGAMLRASRLEAETDALTGLRNRRKLQADLAETLARGAAETSVILMFDLDGFKGYNDSYGHPAGDALLVRLAGRLEKVVEPRGTAYRLGGDEFCVLARGGFAEVADLRARTGAALCEKGEGFSIKSSCGVAVLPHEAPTAAEALRLIDVRMYEEKSSRPSAGKQTMSVLLSALQERDPALVDHTGHVARLASDVGRTLGLHGETLERVALAGQLHDIGKIAIPESILGKPEPLTDAEWAFIKRHTVIGERIVGAAPALAAVGKLIRSSHERWDGAGYPDRLSGDEIPIGARIVFACDSYDSMTSDRPYQAGITPAEARQELRRHAGSQFDPSVVDALLLVLEAQRTRDAA